MPTDISPFAVQHTEIKGLKILRMKQVTDERGTIREFYRESSFLAAGSPRSVRGCSSTSPRHARERCAACTARRCSS
ncbi:MAG TPA: hypothetical protein VHZ03_45425 [Trebonia sp.]|jgi:dTDP-4-dehydrorhamnose 3,5-epimerase-like enzyme|nr:hypothetical protein [Trebonia sp.]